MIRVTVPLYFNVSQKKVVLLGLNWYRSAHYIVNNKAKKWIASIVADNIEGEPILEGQIHAHYKIYIKRRGSDGSNIRSVIEKFVLDAIKTEGYIKDDNADIIISDSSEYFYDKEFPRAEIELTKIK